MRVFILKFCLTRTIYFKTYSFLPSFFFIFVFRSSFIGCNKQILTLLLRALFTPSTLGSAHSFTHSPLFFAYFCFCVPPYFIEYFPMSMLLLFPPVFYFRFNIVVVDINSVFCAGGRERMWVVFHTNFSLIILTFWYVSGMWQLVQLYTFNIESTLVLLRQNLAWYRIKYCIVLHLKLIGSYRAIKM